MCLIRLPREDRNVGAARQSRVSGVLRAGGPPDVTESVGPDVYVAEVVNTAAVQEPTAGDSAAFEAMLRPLIERGYRLACGMLHDPAAAEDAVQEASVKAWRKRGNLRSGSDPLPWYLGIVANQCRNAVRGRWWSVLKIPDVAARSGLDVGESATSSADIRRALQRLGSTDRAIVVLHFYLDLPLDQIASAVSLSEAATRGRLYRALKKLRPGLELDQEEVDR